MNYSRTKSRKYTYICILFSLMAMPLYIYSESTPKKTHFGMLKKSHLIGFKTAIKDAGITTKDAKQHLNDGNAYRILLSKRCMCPACKNSYEKKGGKVKCPECGGFGRIETRHKRTQGNDDTTRSTRLRSNYKSEYVDCKKCDGYGYIEVEACHTCGGRGYVSDGTIDVVLAKTKEDLIGLDVANIVDIRNTQKTVASSSSRKASSSGGKWEACAMGGSMVVGTASSYAGANQILHENGLAGQGIIRRKR